MLPRVKLKPDQVFRLDQATGLVALRCALCPATIVRTPTSFPDGALMHLAFGSHRMICLGCGITHNGLELLPQVKDGTLADTTGERIDGDPPC